MGVYLRTKTLIKVGKGFQYFTEIKVPNESYSNIYDFDSQDSNLQKVLFEDMAFLNVAEPDEENPEDEDVGAVEIWASELIENAQLFIDAGCFGAWQNLHLLHGLIEEYGKARVKVRFWLD